MTGRAFALRGLWFFRKSYLGVLAGSALGAMVLLGALMAGDSVKATLRQIAEARLGKVESVLAGGERMFRGAMAEDLAADGVDAAPVLALRAAVSVPGSGRKMGRVQVLGVDDRFWEFGPGGELAGPRERGFFINDTLARNLDLAEGETLVLRFEKPEWIASEVPLAGQAEELRALRGDVVRVCGEGEFGRFSLQGTQVPQATVFVPIGRLQEAVELEGMVNLMLLKGGSDVAGAVSGNCRLDDYGLSVAEVPLAAAVEIQAKRVFFDRRVVDAIRGRFPDLSPVITYLANTIAAKGRETPYSMVTAVDRAAAPFLPEGMQGVAVNAWEADDLGVAPGDEVRIDFYALENGKRLVERSVSLPVVGVVPMEGLAVDRRWMPDFPGVAEAENAADWEPGVPIDLKRIRDKDEAYWDAHRGTPKLFMGLKRGRELFGNRWGELTALRVRGVTPGEVERGLLDVMTPALAGLELRDVRAEGLAAAKSPVDFAGLFLSMSFFLMVSAVALTAMLFRFHIEGRNRESGLLAAVGIPERKVLRWRLTEGLVVVVAGTMAGALLAVTYTRALLGFLGTIWDEGGAGMFRFGVEPLTWIGGSVGFVGMMMAVIWWVVRKQLRKSASLRLEAGTEEVVRTRAATAPWGALGLGLAGLGAVAMAGSIGRQGAFFLAGLSCLSGGCFFYRWVLRRRVLSGARLTVKRLAELNCARRATRSLVVVGTLASGVFLVVAVAAFRKHGGGDWRERNSGTGGFAFWVETSRAVKWDGGDGFSPVLPFRVGQGEDASCFNLNQVVRPRLLATDVSVLAELGAFRIKAVGDGCEASWETLRDGRVMRAFVDESTLMWVLKKKIGDQLVYQDEWGGEFPVEIAGTLDGTVFQGTFVVDERRFLEHFPSSGGPSLLLTGCGGTLEEGRGKLEKALLDEGAVVSTTNGRLAAFNGVENTYIAIFHVLGGLGVVVGSAGLGLVTARNLEERREEFAVLDRVGVPDAVRREVVRREVWQFIRWGLGIGLVAALLAILPSLPELGMWRTLGWIAMLMGLICGNAWFWSWLGFRAKAETGIHVGEEAL